MAWNEPDDNDRDPWGGRRGDQGPPDLDEVVRRMQEKLGGMFGRGRPSNRTGGGSNQFSWVLIIIAAVLYLAYDMFYRIDAAEQGVVLRFGRYVDTLQPGPHLRFPRPIEYVVKENVAQIRTYTASSTMLTGDENIVDIEIAVQYRIRDLKNFLFEISDPAETIRQVTESSIREVIGENKLDFVITEGRAVIGERARDRIQSSIDLYEAGLQITSVNMQPAKPPEEVKASFDDAIKAREDKQRKINEAEAYSNEVVERASGEASQIRLEAEGYKEQVIAISEGEASRFEQLLVEYRRAPEVTRRRLYLDAVESFYRGSTKVMMDTNQGNSLMYLPIDKLLERQDARDARQPLRGLVPEAPTFGGVPDTGARDRTDARLRGSR
ncbi:MAG: FtsH protease activity modulator HflK [Gammaproteobacteria bacterium]|nr:FtsH protease activity modulator HflK [Gammaproteobacteria bacterium]